VGAATAAFEERLRLFAITRAGLLTITIAVCVLWTCIAMEKTTVARANREVARTFLRLHRLRRSTNAVPAEAPASPSFPRRHSWADEAGNRGGVDSLG
jgi:hypothetical protein